MKYEEVPLISPLGYLLGSYCVVHNELKEYDNEETVEIMNDIAASIMVYLDSVRSKQNRHRSEGLISGLSKFIASDPSTSVSQQGDTGPIVVPDRPQAPEMTSTEAGPDGPSSIGESNEFTDSDKQGRPPPHPNLASASSIESSDSAQSMSGGVDGPVTPQTSLDDEYSQGLANQPPVLEQAAGQDADPQSPSTPVSAGSELPEQHSSGFISSANIKSSFYRAASTIREAMNMDGMVFLDAAPTAYVDHSDQLTIRDSGDATEAAGPFCAAIVQSSAVNHEVGRLPEAVLQRFIKKYPGGHVFSADDSGPIDESYAPGKLYPGTKADRDSRRLRDDVVTLFQVFPAAKYIIFLPLWHFQRECWYAATLGWVTDPTNPIEVTDIGLLAAFGNSVMAEVSRMEAMAASRAKSSFVSSISHELRSPLHGILASSELLRASISDPSLLSTLDMLDSCGRTLLDTFNNLLEHAITIKDSRGPTSPVANAEVVDLGSLVEDVVDAVHFSHLSERAFQSSLTGVQTGVYSTLPSSDTSSGPDRPLLIILNIEKRDWNLSADAGVWKRFVMNIFGNALKYTKTGRIEVSLRMQQKMSSTVGLSNYVCLKVEDTGRGMSSDYVKYRLFTPFSQEDTYSPGIGLGLSIVQQLAKSLGGTIDVKSSVSIGTAVEVCLPVKRVPDGVTGTEPSSLLAAYDQRLRGRTLCLITSKAYQGIAKRPARGKPEKSSRPAAAERAIQVNACEIWGMELVVASEGLLPKADVYVLDSEFFRDLVQEKSGDGSIAIPSVSPLLLLCSGAGAPLCSSSDAIKNHGIHLHHPIGPKKLFSAIVSALDAPRPRSAGKTTDSVSGSPPLHVLLPAPSQTPSVAVRLEPNEAAADSKPTTEAPLQESSALHVLLVDDNPINLKLLAATVRKLKHTFATACDGLEAVQLYKKGLDEGRPFDVTLMDLNMPVMTGFEATRQIRDLEVEAKVTGCMIAALTGLSSEVSRKEAMASGSDLFITKPVKLLAVKQLLDQQLQKKKTETST